MNLANRQKLVDYAQSIKAPLAMLEKPSCSTRRHSSLGSTASAAKEFRDTRNGRRISLAQAKMIISKWERLAGI